MPNTFFMPEAGAPCASNSGVVDYQGKVLVDRPNGFWPMQENNVQFTVHEISRAWPGVRGYDAVPYGDATLNVHPGPFASSSAVDFDGTIDEGYLLTDGDPWANLIGGREGGGVYWSWTWEIWFSCTTQLANGALMDKTFRQLDPDVETQNHTLWVLPAGTLQFKIDNGSNNVTVTSVSTNADNDLWHHVAITREVLARGDAADQVRLWYDGSLETTQPWPAPTGSSSHDSSGFLTNTDWCWGAKARGGYDHFDGQVAFAAVYPYALSSTQIANHANHS